jgi:hypothetical protein
MENNRNNSHVVREGSEAIESLKKLIEAVENGDMWGLSDQQAVAMVRVAKVLIAAVDDESTVWKSLVQSGLLSKLKSTMEKLVEQLAESKQEHNLEEFILEKEALESRVRRCDK